MRSEPRHQRVPKCKSEPSWKRVPDMRSEPSCWRVPTSVSEPPSRAAHAAGEPKADLARRFNANRGTIFKIVNNQQWIEKP